MLPLPTAAAAAVNYPRDNIDHWLRGFEVRDFIARLMSTSVAGVEVLGYGDCGWS